MSSAQIQKKIKAGLARAQKKTGSTSSEKVYLVKSTTTAGSPVSPGVTTTTTTELVNAIFIDYDARVFDINILDGDRRLVCDNVSIIKQGDDVIQGSLTYRVVSISIVAPASDVLLYMPQLRLK